MTLAHGQRRSDASSWLFVLTVIGYPVAALFSSAFDLDSRSTSIPFRVLVILLSLWVIFAPPYSSFPRATWTLLGFASIYLARLVWDAGFASVPGAADALVFFLATVLLPCIALWVRSARFDEDATARLMLYVGSLICLAVVVMDAFGIGEARSLTEATGRLSYESLNPISVGHAAVSTLIAGLVMARTRLRGMDLPIILAGSVCAIIALGLSAARGPVVALAAAAVIYAVATGRWHWLILALGAAMYLLVGSDTAIWERFAGMEDDQSSIERLALQGSAVSAFLASPLLGSAFVEPLEFTYPHNLFIETALALGVVGLALLTPLLVRCVRGALGLARRGRLFLPMLFMQYFVGSQLSGAIWGNAAFWASGTLLLVWVATGPVAERRRYSQRAPVRLRSHPA